MSDRERKTRIRLLVVAVTLRGGGAERQVVHLLRSLDRARFCPHLYLFKAEGAYLDDLPAGVPLSSPHVRGKRGLPKVLLHLRQKILSLQPDIAFANMWPESVSLIGVSKTIPWSFRPKIVVGIQNNPRFYGERRMRTIQWLRADIDSIVACSEGVRQGLLKVHPSFRDVQVIRNSVDLSTVRKKAQEPLEHPWLKEPIPILVGVGRLVEQKGFRYLLSAVHLIRRTTAVRLWILGRGPLKSALKQQAQDLGISHHVQLLGFRPNPFRYMARSDVFVLSSLWEGLPSVLVEAMGLGLPVVATRAPYGPEDVIENDVNGYLVPVGDPEAIAASVDYLLRNPDQQDRIRNTGKTSVEERFSASHMSQQYESLFREVVKR